IHTALRERTRRHLGREATPSAAILDRQSVKTGQRGAAGLRRPPAGERAQTPSGGGYPGLCAQGSSLGGRGAGPGGARLLAHTLQLYGPDLPRFCLIWADAGYRGQLADELRQQMGWTREVVKRSDQQPRSAFAVQPHRWIVERTFIWGADCAG